MDTSNPAAFVNGEFLRFYVGRRVRAVLQVVQSDDVSVIGKSTDEKQLFVKGFPPPSPLTKFVEVIGVADSDKSIRAEIWTNFGDAIVRKSKEEGDRLLQSQQYRRLYKT